MSEDMDKGMPFITKAIIVGIISVVVIIFAAGISWFVATRAIKTNVAKPNVEAGDGHEEKKAKAEVGPMVSLGEQTVNLSDEGEAKYLLFDLTVELEKTKEAEKGVAEVEEKKVIILDKILTIVKAKTVADINADKDFVKLKKEIIAGINPFFEKVKVKNIYFGKWIVQ